MAKCAGQVTRAALRNDLRVIAFPFSAVFVSKAAGHLHPETKVTMQLVSEASAGEYQGEHT